MPRVAVRCVGAEHQVALLCPRRHPRRGTGALDVEDHRRHLGVVRQADELRHQRNARAGRWRERARARPRRANHHADRGQLVLGLQDGKPVLFRLRLDAVFLAEALERLHQRCRGRNRIPRTHRCTGVEAPERCGGVPVDEDRVGGLVHRLEMNRQRAGEMLLREVVTKIDRLPVRIHQRRLARKLLREQRPDDLGIHVEQRRERAGIRDVLHQDPLAHAFEGGVAHLCERNAERGHVRTNQPLVERPGRVVRRASRRGRSSVTSF